MVFWRSLHTCHDNFLKNSEKRGAKIITVIDLFLFQGIESFIIFTGQEKLRKEIMNNYGKIRDYFFEKLIACWTEFYNIRTNKTFYFTLFVI